MPSSLNPVVLPLSLWIVLGVVLLFQVLLLVGQVRLGGRLKRLERGRRAKREPEFVEIPQELPESLEERKSTAKEGKQAFQEFLAEDPARAELPKKEQFTAFRKWRSERGLNWDSGSSAGGSDEG